MSIIYHKELLGFNDPNDILLKTKIRLMRENMYLYYLYAPCSSIELKNYYYTSVERIKTKKDSIKIINHLMSIRKDNLHKIIMDRGFIEDIIEGLSFDFKLDKEINELSNYIKKQYEITKGRH